MNRDGINVSTISGWVSNRIKEIQYRSRSTKPKEKDAHDELIERGRLLELMLLIDFIEKNK